jgi:diacylglycerol kinase (ATP)
MGKERVDFFFEIHHLSELACMTRKIIYLINPVSGTRSKRTVRDLIARKTQAAGIDFEILPSNADGSYGNLQEVIRQDRITDVVICGGDGTVNAVLNALRDEPVRFGILPIGSGNSLALAAKIPRQASRALEIIFKGKTYPTDAFYINEKFSCALCGIGFDAEVAHQFAKKKTRGLQTYLRLSTIRFFQSKPYPFEIRVDDRVIQTDAYFISIANSNQFGNQFTIAPSASLSDGLLDIVIVKKMNKLILPVSVLWQVAGMNRLRDVVETQDRSNIIYVQSDKISIRNPALAPLHIDGEPAETCEEFQIRIIRNCFRLIQP